MEPPTPLPFVHTAPALLDLQVNGYAGLDFNGDPKALTPEALRGVRLRMVRRGIGAACPTLITDDPERMLARAKAIVRATERDADLRAFFPLLHLEGPFISPEDGPRGAHPREHAATPDQQPDFLDRMLDAAHNRVGLVTLAPELPGALAFIERLRERGIVPALGHTSASADQLRDAVSAGALLSSHLGNGSHQVLPRLDNYVQRQLADDRLRASFVADGHHVPFPTLQNFLRAKTPARSLLVTDAIAAAELPPGRYTLGGMTVEVSPTGRAAKPGEPNLAGSVLTLDRAVVNVTLHCGIPFETAWRMASQNPADLLGMAELPAVTVTVSEEGFRMQVSTPEA